MECLQQPFFLFKNLETRPARACTPRCQIAQGTFTGAAPEGVRQQEHALLLGHHAVAGPGRGIDAREGQRLIKRRVPDSQIGQHCAAHLELAVTTQVLLIPIAPFPDRLLQQIHKVTGIGSVSTEQGQGSADAPAN